MIIVKYALKFRIAVVVVMVASALIGALTYFTMPREGAPDITIPYVFVSAPYQGVAPTEIENLITIPLERKFNDLENVKEVRSVSSEGISSIVIEFTPKEDLNNALQRVKDKIDLAKPDLPKDLDQPIVNVINFSTDMPILTMALFGNVEEQRLKKIAQELQDKIENYPGVKQVNILGTREREIRIEIDPSRLVATKTTFYAVMQAIVNANKTISAGNLEMKGGKFQVRVPGEFELVPEIQKIVIQKTDSSVLYLSDVASVSDTFKDVESISRLNGKPCVSLMIKKRSGENTLKLIREIVDIVDKYPLPEGISKEITHDQSEHIKSMVEELENSMVSGSLLVVLILLVSIGWRNSVFVGLAIPLSMFISFVVMLHMGVTLNFVVLFGLVMAAGMLVDDAVVIVENIFRNRSAGLSRMDAALKGANEVAWPVTTSTLTAALFLWPLLSWPNIVGQFLRFLPLTLILTRFASLFVALIINPAMCSFYITSEKTKKSESGKEDHPILDWFERFLRGVMEHRALVLVIGLLMFVATIMLYMRFNCGLERFPTSEPRRATVEVRYPQGTHIEKTDAALKMIETKLSDIKDVKFYQANAGMGAEQNVGSHLGMISVEFVPKSERKVNSLQIVEQIREKIGDIAGAEIKVNREKMGPPGLPPISIEISGDDFETLSAISAEVTRSIKTVPGLVDLQDDLEDARPEFQFRLDRQRLGMLGLNASDIGTYLRTSIYGMEISKFRSGEDEYDITIRLPKLERNSADLLRTTFIPLPGGQAVPLTSLGQIVYTGGRGNIMRKDQRRVITITGDKQGRSIDEILKDVAKRTEKIQIPQGYTMNFTGENKEMKEDTQFLGNAFLIGIFMIAIVLVIQFNSVILPCIIIITVSLAMMGVMWGLMICRLPFGVIMTGLGVLTLGGVVVNNSIVLIDCINKKREEGLSALEAAIAGGRQRLRPVMLTAICAIFGLIPMAVGWNIEIHTFPWKFVAGAESGAWWAPMAVAVIFGLAVATILTLVFVPLMYTLAEQSMTWIKQKLRMSESDD